MLGSASVSEREKCLEAGMDDYMTKPVRIDRLKTMLAESRKRYPNRHLTEHTVPQFDQLTLADRQVLQRAMSAALSAAKGAEQAERAAELASL